MKLTNICLGSFWWFFGLMEEKSSMHEILITSINFITRSCDMCERTFAISCYLYVTKLIKFTPQVFDVVCFILDHHLLINVVRITQTQLFPVL